MRISGTGYRVKTGRHPIGQKVESWSEYVADSNWNASGKGEWEIEPEKYTVEGKFKTDVPAGTYIISLAILDPAGNLPSLRFATGNYLKGGRHPFGTIDFKTNRCEPLPSGFPFDDPADDHSLSYNLRID